MSAQPLRVVRDEKFASRPSDEAFTPWLAGFFDGEGCICITTSKGYPFVQVLISQKDTSVLEEIQEVYGGGIYPRKNDWGFSHQLCINKQVETKKIMEDMLPFLRVKRDKALEALEVIGEPGHRRKGRKNGVTRIYDQDVTSQT